MEGERKVLEEIERRRMLFHPEDPEEQAKEKTNEELREILLGFIRRVSAEESKKTSAEVRILPEMIRLLML